MSASYDHRVHTLHERFDRERAAYRLRMLAATVVSLLLVLAAVRLPVSQAPARLGWQFPRDDDRMIQLEEVREEPKPTEASGAPITFFANPEAEEKPEGRDLAGEQETLPEEEKGPPLPDVPLERMVLTFAEEMPTIRGGLGAYYINIQYPRAAIEAGIQGRLVLEFVVEPDGRPTDIRVVKSLHPLCDSAAVRALRRTRFMPGRQNGEVVPVRMRLPVSFRLIDGSRTDSTATDTSGGEPDTTRSTRF
jgi:protein TonB